MWLTEKAGNLYHLLKHGTMIFLKCNKQNKTKQNFQLMLKSSEEYGLNKDWVVLLEQIRTIDKGRLKEKISTVSEKFLEYIDAALSVELNITRPVGSLKEQELKNYIYYLTKPLLITEGKTDVQLIETAWKKLYPDESMFFQCNASGIGFEKKNRTGNADNVRRSI